ncbi:SMP-30/gluconolactonase/LRE family protein [Microbacterium sp. SSW1-49]|uniref:SMP-30/gluconolactonase/LRE family protein n=1 Tax=Microbacterium croceum TaxID=2851645 RepID=A0ABT0FA43_9MICO|nr:SMP-30/gluconolactonase/LRE family protein [Microbacterium croceum]MCK2034941.1 SMP-30/gluconolactonase/LRE family protein [Microbacterium croceum]
MPAHAAPPTALTRPGAAVGESPIWLTEESSLAWIDMPVGRIHVSSTPSGETSTVDLGRYLSAIAPRMEGGWIATTLHGFAWIGRGGDVARELEMLDDRHRMNDACCDPRGRLIAGSTHVESVDGAGSLHLLDGDGTVTTIWDGLTLPNGMAWSANGKTLYLADSLRSQIVAFEMDDRGLPQRADTIAEFAPGDGLPDGLCLDEEGCLWVAMWDGGAVVRLDPDGDVMRRVALPVFRPTSCAFGGRDGDVLFVTTATAERWTHPLDGAVLAIDDTGVRGDARPPFRG